MNKKIKEKILFFFELEGLKKIQQFNFREIIAKAKNAHAVDFSCPICRKKDPYYVANITNPKNQALFRIKKVCSLNCLKEYLARNIKNNSLHKEAHLHSKGLQQELIMQIAGSLNTKELEQIKPSNLKMAVKEMITNYEKKHSCFYCQQPEKGWELSIAKTNFYKFKNILSGRFCSKKCLKKFYDEKI